MANQYLLVDFENVQPDPLNPRYSYGAGKLISEIMAINYGRKFFESVLIFRPHNVYGPDMGFEHVIPQFALRLHTLATQHAAGPLRLGIQGTGGAQVLKNGDHVARSGADGGERANQVFDGGALF